MSNHREVRVAIAGIGNVASSLIQGVEYYNRARGELKCLGLANEDVGGYLTSDIRFVAGFDVNSEKIGKDLSEAIFAKPNCVSIVDKVPKIGARVFPAPIFDSVAKHMITHYNVSEYTPVDVVSVLRETKADILVNLIPVGSRIATEHYAEACLEAGCAMINGIPEFIASDRGWGERFRNKDLPIAGDDVKSQLGATILHRALVNLMRERGVRVDETYQLNVGGNTDFLNMMSEERLKTKRISKTEAVTSLVTYEVPTRIGPSDFVPFLGDTKVAYMWVKGRIFGGMPVQIDIKLSVADSPDAAGVLIDVIRLVKMALDRGLAGPLENICAYYFKHPPLNVPDDEAKRLLDDFIKGG
ncbi:MAG: inositol-3-phosphate synthase [Candidatus Bathyarchaeia archaeon]